MFSTAPMMTVIIPTRGNPCALMKGFIPRLISTGAVALGYIIYPSLYMSQSMTLRKETELTEMRYQCWTLHHLKSRPRLCFFSKSGSVAAHTKGDHLLGYLSPEGNEECPFEGRLYRPVEAYERLLDYYTALRANHADFRLRVEPTSGPVTVLPAVPAPALSLDQVMFKDYILQTL